MRFSTVLAILIFIANFGYGKGNLLSEKVNDVARDASKIDLNIVNHVADNSYDDQLKKYLVFKTDHSNARIAQQFDEKIEVAIPSPDGIVEATLVKADIFTDDYLIQLSSDDKSSLEKRGTHYWGIIKNDENSYATVSFFENQWMAIFSNSEKGNLVVKKLNDSDNYISYYESDIINRKRDACGTIEDAKDIERIQRISKNFLSERRMDNCVRMHVECTHATFNKFGSANETLEYIEGLFSNVIAMYLVEEIKMSVSYIKMWDTQDPFLTASSGVFTASFGAQFGNEQTLNGDLGHLLSTVAIGGIAGQASGIGSLCSEAVSRRVAWSSIDGNLATFPTYSEDVSTVVHEIGHNMGSPHTHGCYWNGNNTQIDDCGNLGQGSNAEGAACFDRFNAIIPSGGGTIMSYCHLNPTGIDLNKGFGQQPGDLVRGFYNNASCLRTCLDEEETCGTIYNYHITSSSENSITVRWSSSDATSYKLSWNKLGESATTPITVTSPYEINGLDGGSKYDITLVAVCPSGFEMDPVVARGNTDCDQTYSIPYFETFEEEVWELNTNRVHPCWTTKEQNFYNWLIGNTGTFTGLTGPRVDHTTGIGKYMLANADLGSTNDRTDLTSPWIDITDGQGHFVSFWYFMFGSAVNKIDVQARSEGGSWSTIGTISGQQQTDVLDPWEQEVISLSDFSGSNVQMRFRTSRGTSDESDIAIDDFLVSDSSFIDLNVFSINRSISACELSQQEEIEITVQNSGFSKIPAGASIGLSYSVNDVNTVNETLTLQEDLNPGQGVDFTFATKADLSAFGTQIIEATVNYAQDLVDDNNSRILQVLNKPVIKAFPYTEDFESGNGNWLSGGENSTWEFGTPAKGVIKGASSGVNAWVTGGLAPGSHEAYEDSYIESPCLDFSFLKDPEIELDLWWDIEYQWDAAALLASKDGGQTWQKIGKVGDPDNWYNAVLIADALLAPGGNKDAWTGSKADNNTGSRGWVTAKHALDGFSEEPNVLIRLVFQSDPFVENDGIGLDNIILKGESLIPPCHEITLNETTCNENEAGEKVETFTAAGNCDSVVTTITTLLPSYDIKNTTYTCNADEVDEVVQNLSTKAGCDSTITDEILLVPSYDESINLTTCVVADTGTVIVSMSTTNAGCDSIITTTTTLEEISANFTFEEGDGPNNIEFTNTSTGAESYVWDFGDTESSTEESPTHLFEDIGTYTVVLTASKDGCEDGTSSQEVEILNTGISLNFIDQLRIFPNPNTGQFTLTMEGESGTRDIVFSIVDVSGKVLQVQSEVYRSGLQKTFDLSNYANGEYLLNIQSGNQKASFKIALLR